jgi:monoamine oxidase
MGRRGRRLGGGQRVGRQAGTLSRREFLRDAGVVGAGAAAAGVIPQLSKPSFAARRSGPKVVIVGAGAAGVRCAHRLWTAHGIEADLYDASPDRLGGRAYTVRGVFEGRDAEAGGSFISTEHTVVRRLCRQLGLTVVDVHGGAQRTGVDVYTANGVLVSDAELRSDLHAASPAIQRALDAAGDHSARTPTRGGRTLDRLSVAEWVDRDIPGGTGGRLGQILLSDAIAEYGGDPGDQSALNLIWLLEGIDRKGRGDLAGTDEAGHIAEGSDALITRMLDELPSGADGVQRATQLVAARQSASGPVASLESGGNIRDVPCDALVLAVPFSTLRAGVDLAGADLSPRKKRAVASLGMGTNAKLQLQLADRSWTPLGYSGIAYSGPEGFGTVWDGSSGDTASAPILVGFPGGAAGAALGSVAFGPAEPAAVQQFLGQVEPVFSGTRAQWSTGSQRSHAACWARNDLSLGAYSFYKPGQITDFGGTEIDPAGAIFFCGEHTSFEFQGYIEGALRTGAQAADRIGV